MSAQETSNREPALDAPFQRAAALAVRRLTLARWFAAMRRSALPLFAPLIALAAALHLGGFYHLSAVPPATVIVSWTVLTAFWALARRPSPIQALAFWDERAGRDETFVSAYCFELEELPEEGELLHLHSARRMLQAETGRLRKDLPAPFPHRAWLLPLMLLGCTALGPGDALIPPEEQVLDKTHGERTRRAGESLADKSGALERLKGLTEEEKEKVREITASLGETAEKMRKLSLKTQRDVLAELDRRAREAEKLAEELGFDEEDLLSSDMIAELERHADTADFASSIRAADLGDIATEAEKIAGKLAREELSLEEQKRIEDALNRALKAGTESDKRKLIGKKIGEAGKDLKDGRRLLASKRFSEIAEHFLKNQQRQQARRQLQRLADALRASGRNIFGRNQAGLKHLKQSRYAGLQPLQYRQMQLLRNMPFGNQNNPGASGRMALLPNQSNLPGTGQMQGLLPGAGQTPTPGSSMGQMPGAGMGQTPIPGSGAGLNPAAGGAGQAPVPGGMTSAAMQGGLMAGHGSAPYGAAATKPLDASRTGVVEGRLNEDGPSTARAIDGRLHREEAQRSMQEIAIAFIKSEEEALSDEPLPLSRREQILRYFTALRRQIENEP